MAMAISAATFYINAPVSANSHSNAQATLNEVYAERGYQRAKEVVLWSQPIMGIAMTLVAIEWD